MRLSDAPERIFLERLVMCSQRLNVAMETPRAFATSICVRLAFLRRIRILCDIDIFKFTLQKF